MTVIDRFATLEDAAYCYAMLTPEGREDAAKLAKAEALRQEQDMTSAQAIATADEEGLELQTGGSGFVGVYKTPPTFKLPFQARVWRGGKYAILGYFASAEAAALCSAWKFSETQVLGTICFPFCLPENLGQPKRGELRSRIRCRQLGVVS